MIRSNRAWTVIGKAELALAEHPIGELRSDEVLCKLRTCGICGSDTTVYHSGGHHASGESGHIVLGHELVGEVVALGKKVKHLHVGDMVAVEPGIPCGECRNCRAGIYNCCERMLYMGTPPQHGGLSEYFAWPAQWCYRLPDELASDPVLASLVEPMAACREGLIMGQAGLRLQRERASSLPELWAAILGGGSMAMLTLAMIKSNHPETKVMLFARSAESLELARMMGADETVLLNSEASLNDGVFRESIEIGAVGSLYECTGHEPLLQSAIRAKFLLGLGVIVCVGCHYHIELDVAHLRRSSLQVSQVRRSLKQFPSSIADLAAHPELFRPAIGHVADFADFDQIMSGHQTGASTGTNGPKTVIVAPSN